MTRPDTTGNTGGSPLRDRIEECARLLQATRHLDPHAQKALADLLREMARELHPDDDDEHAAQLVASSAELIEALQHPRDPGMIASARARLEEATARAETEAPVATGFVRRIIEALSNIGV